jgi:hypothetical protein
VVSSEFSITHLPPSVSKAQITITFQLSIASLSPSDRITLSLLFSDDNGLYLSCGMVALIISTLSLTFSGF